MKDNLHFLGVFASFLGSIFLLLEHKKLSVVFYIISLNFLFPSLVLETVDLIRLLKDNAE